MKNAISSAAAASTDEEVTALLASHGYWAMSTIIEDEDLTFGGKALSAWHEEDRRRASFEEEHRGRTRVREYHAPHPASAPHKPHHEYPHRHQHYRHQTSQLETKTATATATVGKQAGAQGKKSSATATC